MDTSGLTYEDRDDFTAKVSQPFLADAILIPPLHNDISLNLGACRDIQ